MRHLHCFLPVALVLAAGCAEDGAPTADRDEMRSNEPSEENVATWELELDDLDRACLESLREDVHAAEASLAELDEALAQSVNSDDEEHQKEAEALSRTYRLEEHRLQQAREALRAFVESEGRTTPDTGC